MKKILTMICAAVMALCVAGCGLPKVDYQFASAETFHDEFDKMGLLEAEKFYTDKRVEIVTEIIQKGRDYDLGGDERKGVVYIDRLEFRNEDDRREVEKNDKIRFSGRFRRYTVPKESLGGKIIIVFDYDDVILVEKIW